jgi:hypothetical protein
MLTAVLLPDAYRSQAQPNTMANRPTLLDRTAWKAALELLKSLSSEEELDDMMDDRLLLEPLDEPDIEGDPELWPEEEPLKTDALPLTRPDVVVVAAAPEAADFEASPLEQASAWCFKRLGKRT